ncbi:MAG: peptide deformylase [bacterium]|nr:peptide deformylase [bacterium]
MKRRDFLKFAIISVLAATGGLGILKTYKHTAGVGKIFEYPDPILRKISAPVDAFDDNIVALSRQMITTLRYYSLVGFFSKAFIGRGMAAPQVGILKRLIVCGLYGEIKVLLNPEIIEKRGAYSGYESCLSVPNYERSIIQRPAYVKVRYTGPDNTKNELTAAKGYAALLAHEIDHLNGVLYIDHT